MTAPSLDAPLTDGVPGRPANDEPPNFRPRGYAICTAPRSGSNLLCQLLESTGVLGRPREYFNGHGRRVFDNPAYPDDPQEQIRQILSTGATPNGVYGLKIFAHQHDWIAGQIAWTRLLPRLCFVRLKRVDLLRQAISWVRAMQSGQYRWGQPGDAEAHYDGAQIALQLRSLVTEYARWDLYFARNGIAPLHLTYEGLTQDPQAAVASVARHLGVTGPVAVQPSLVTVQIQRNSDSEDWRARFLREYGDRDLMETL